jgi:arylsulfatase A-like enzyme
MNSTRIEQTPSILMVVADDHRHDCMHGDRVKGPTTPTLDHLAENGTEFTGARIMGGDTQAICVPSRAALLTGCGSRRALATPHSSDFRERQCLAPDRVLLGEALGQAGYRTHAVGKWHNDPAALNRSFASGDALLLRGMSAHETPPLHAYDESGTYDETKAIATPGFSTELFADAAIRFIETTAEATSPFFLYCAFTSPHDPRTPPREFRDRYEDEKIALPANFLPQHPFDNGELEVRDELLENIPRDPAAVRRHRGDYYGMVEHHDHHLGRMLEALTRTGQRDNTIIVYVSDHGLALGSHGLMGKQNLYEHSIRVPLIMSGPGIPKGKTVTSDVYSHRIFATLCELSGVTAPQTLEQPSLAPLWTTQSNDPAFHFAHYFDMQRTVKDERWKLIHYEVNGTTREQLFDLTNDPHELDNIISDPATQPHCKRLSAALEKWWTS